MIILFSFTRRIVVAMLLSSSILFCTFATATSPGTVNYQGYLSDASGAAIDDSVLVTFAIYDVPGGGVPLWSEGQLVSVENGLFSVTLGESIPLPAGLADTPRYLGVTVATDPEMLPRRLITAAMFALNADDAEQLGGAPPSAYDQSSHVSDTGNPHDVSASQIGAVSAGDLTSHAGDAAAHHAPYTDGAAVSAVLAADGPGSGLDADSVDGVSSESLLQTSGDFGRAGVASQLFEGGNTLTNLYVNEGQPDSIVSSMIVNESITSADLAVSSVGSSEIATGAVGASEIASNAVGTFEIADGNVFSNDLANGAVTAAKINFSINATDSDLNGGLISLTNTAAGSGGNSPFALLGQASGSQLAGNVFGIGGLSPGLGAGAPLGELPGPLNYGAVGVVDSGTGVAGLSNFGIGVYADGTTMAVKGTGINGPTNGYAGVQGTTDFDGNAAVDLSGFEIGLLGVSNGASVSDNYGVYGYSNNVGVFGVGTRLAGKFAGTVEVGTKGEMTLTGSQITMQNAAGETAIIMDADAAAGSRIQAGTFAVTGGADLSENFHIGDASPIEPGTVVSIDPLVAGKLAISREAYDRKVAGIVSGAGGVHTGMIMGQRGSIADGDYPVALTGRVYVKADATTGAIRPGDLLTTSAREGYAMRVDDHARAPGAIIGKAMTSLDQGTGLVLVLVTLQ